MEKIEIYKAWEHVVLIIFGFTLTAIMFLIFTDKGKEDGE
jgi:hypothetical protein